MSKENELNFDRRQALRVALGVMAAAGADPAVLDAWMEQAQHDMEKSGGAPKKYRPLAEGNPTFFTADEFKTLTRMVDLIIPRTDTPGAAEAGVPLYIDIIVASDPALGERYRKGLKDLDAAAVEISKKRFVDAGSAAQTRVLESMLPKNASGNDFFERVKAMTLVGYYSSEIGLFQELHFKGNEALGSFPGCPHGGHRLDVPARGTKKIASVIHDTNRLWQFPESDDITAEDL